MSLRKKVRKIRTKSSRTFRVSVDTSADGKPLDFKAVISETLHEAFGGTGMSIKMVMGITGAGERTVKNWFEGKNGPNGENLVQLIRHTDEILEAMLVLAHREEILLGKRLIDARGKLVEMLESIDQLIISISAPDP